MILSVSQLNNLIKGILDSEPMLSKLMVRGEVSQIKTVRGYCYFTIKDETASADCFCLENKNIPAVGRTVIVECTPSYYTVNGRLSFYVSTFIPEDKEGALYAAFIALKEKLAGEGIFDEGRKRKIDIYTERIGIITSAQGAAVRDIINVVRRRNRSVDLVIYPAAVQGETAASELKEGINYFNGRADIGTVIIGRGGGSYESLNCFNDEELVRAVASSVHPVISAVGHETDFTLCDFAADLRAPTPSAAAELATVDAEKLKADIKGLLNAATRAVNNKMDCEKSRVFYLTKKCIYSQRRISDLLTRRVFRMLSRGRAAAEKTADQERSRLYMIMMRKERLKALYSAGILLTKEGVPVISVKQVKEGDNIEARLGDGVLSANITEVKNG